ncbi:hypothetical protein EHW99_1082 [Erwinia amylovora]|uniref:Uncharacterized protein n=3 Tax=Erwinia amylovora TaxID=552 RepID=A0A831A3Q9_ERWAM|nr:hypothetical protein EaACW_2531 [Erwinia amylovora ACW56400]QJQ53789.1 hypothetical protein EHX00_1082 [Erwinia amylovora]CBA21877.1 hypothetical protein predicted by Glimmer/Critica [Erwinia amylovora CFBP1430]CBX81399.1 hypothetical protein predicted by Glimmer/Critica [Erwinia amylovora ATCC BAA-2158]CCO79379.1 hypothetical protein BN432_2600 [Erwinia amylovora Ea356]CCO83181.1 hypothetical protein BN433_2622 [Erwinia amylovora Ea266]CCO86944.1 hypothetical protein BN434_2573 [Erwinia a
MVIYPSEHYGQQVVLPVSKWPVHTAFKQCSDT